MRATCYEWVSAWKWSQAPPPTAKSLNILYSQTEVEHTTLSLWTGVPDIDEVFPQHTILQTMQFALRCHEVQSKELILQGKEATEEREGNALVSGVWEERPG